MENSHPILIDKPNITVLEIYHLVGVLQNRWDIRGNEVSPLAGADYKWTFLKSP
jgi:hypothetical protein